MTSEATEAVQAVSVFPTEWTTLKKNAWMFFLKLPELKRKITLLMFYEK